MLYSFLILNCPFASAMKNHLSQSVFALSVSLTSGNELFPVLSDISHYDISIHSVTIYLPHYTHLNRPVSLQSLYNYDEILIRADLTCADMPMLSNVYSRWQQVQRMPGEETFLRVVCISIGRTCPIRLLGF